MGAMFYGCTSLTELNIKNFDTRTVNNMADMFYGCTNLTELDLSNFDTSNVSTMAGMFYGCTNLTELDLSAFDTSRVGLMSVMFSGCTNLTELDLSNFDTSRVCSMNGMFSGCCNLTSLDISNFNTSSVASMSEMFANCSKLEELDVTNFDTSNVEHIAGMFYNCNKVKELDVSGFVLSDALYDRSPIPEDELQARGINYMFYGCSSITELDLTGFSMQNRILGNEILEGCTSLTQIKFSDNWKCQVKLPTPSKEGVTYTGWYSDSAFTTKVADLGARYTPSGAITIYAGDATGIYATLYTDGTLAFTATPNKLAEGKTEADVDTRYNNVYFGSIVPWKYNANIKIVEFVDVIKPIYTSYWFYRLENLKQFKNISNLNTSNVTDMLYMFGGCSSLTSLDLSNFDTSNVTNMSYMFDRCNSLTSLDISNFDTCKVTNMEGMFYKCSSLTNLDLSNFDTSNVTDMGGMFGECSSLTNLDLSNFNTSNVTDMMNMFYKCSSLESLNVSSFDISKVTTIRDGVSSYGMFSYCSSLTNLDLSNFDTSNVTDMGSMFFECSSLTNLDLSNFDTSNVTGMDSMFSGCSSLTSLDISNFDTSNVTGMGRMFSGCSSLTSLDISNFDTSNVTYMGGMFYKCSSLTNLDLSNFDTSNVTGMGSMFGYCSSLTNLDLSNFDTSNVTSMANMFFRCSGLTSVNLSSFNTSNVTGMRSMFFECSSLANLNLSNFDASNVTDMVTMFSGCSSLTQITFGTNWTQDVQLPRLVKAGVTYTGWYSDPTFTNKVANCNSDSYFIVPRTGITIYAGFEITDVTPEIDGFNKSTTYYVTYDALGNEDTSVPLSSPAPDGWYDYSSQKWANVVVKDPDTGYTAYFTWIPRYMYVTDSTTETVDAVFVDTNNREIFGENKLNASYKLPEAFTWGDTDSNLIQLSGFWISKYRLSENYQSRPDVLCKAETAETWIIGIRKMEPIIGRNETIDETSGLAQTPSNNIDVHMQKNTEYGATILLGASQYGKQGTGTERYMINGSTTASGTDSKASSTGNVSGVYGLGFEDSGFEWVAGGLTMNKFYGESELTNVLPDIAPRYINRYTTDTSSAKMGDATIETENWQHLDYAAGYGSDTTSRWISNYSNNGLFIRGGVKGTFFYGYYGNAVPYYEQYSRACIVVSNGI